MANGKVAESEQIVVRCPVCGAFLMRGTLEGRVDTNCKNSRCGATLDVTVKSGVVTTSVVKRKRA